MPFVVSYLDGKHRVAIIVPDPADALPFRGRRGFQVHPIGRPVPEHGIDALAAWTDKLADAADRERRAERAKAWASMTDAQRRAWGLAVVPDDAVYGETKPATAEERHAQA